MALITLRNVSLSFGHHSLLDQVNLNIEPRQRICLIGRNGAGKSSMLKLIQGEIQADSGELILEQGVRISSLSQEVPLDINNSIFEVVLSGLGELGQVIADYEKQIQSLDQTDACMELFSSLQQKIEHLDGWNVQQQVHTVLSRLQLNGESEFSSLSGGLKRRVLLAKALVSAPDLLLLDEPTNHLDIESIQWLEQFLPEFKGSILFITHDRVFLQKIATNILELDRGQLINFSGPYDKFLQHKESLLNAETQQNDLFDKRLAQEEVWIRQGIKARRTRNEGRVRALEKMRKEHQARRTPQGQAKIKASDANKSGKIVLKAHDISFLYEDKQIFKDFSCQILRGDKIGILGSNGSGKTTLLNVLLGKNEPTNGSVEHGTQLQVAYFDQMRNQLKEELSIRDNVAEGSDFIEINTQKIHILTYLQNFLFTPERSRTPVSALSGGERNRLLLAKLLSKPSNVLVLDEPTNDLDLETLELLEDLLLNYPGTILLVSHDREFLNNVVSSTIVFEEQGKLNEYVGGYDDWLRQKVDDINPVIKIKPKPKLQNANEQSKIKKVTYSEQKRLASLPHEIEVIEQKIASLHELISSSEFYQQSESKIKVTQQELVFAEAKLEELFELWEKLEE